MSVVSGIILQVNCIDAREDPDPGNEVWSRIDEWLAKHPSGPFDPLVDVTDHLVVHKHPQTYVCGGGYNYFPEEEFATFVMGLPWESPDNVVLLIEPDDGPTKVFRPPHDRYNVLVEFMRVLGLDSQEATRRAIEEIMRAASGSS